MQTRKTRAALALLLVSALGLTVSAPVLADTYQDALQKGEQLFKAEEYDQAIQSLTRAADAQDPEIAKFACVYLGLCYDSKGDSESTIAWYERALEKDAQFLLPLELLSGVYFSTESNYLKGMKLAERAEALHSEEPSLYYNMARYHALAGEAGPAVSYIDKAIFFGFSALAQLSTDPDFKAVRKIEPFKSLISHINSISAGNKLRDQGIQSQKAGAIEKALQQYQGALDRYQQALGTDSLVGTFVVQLTGMVNEAEGQHDAAIACYEKVLAIWTKVFGAEHPNLVASYNSLGLAHSNKGEYDQAIGYYEKALAIRLKALGEEHPSVAASYNNLGLAYDHNGEYDRAITSFEKALAIRLKALGAEHPDVALSYNNLGGACNDNGEYDKAIGYYEKALAIRLKVLGAEHPDVADCYHQLGAAYNSKGEYDRAIEYLSKALAIWTKVLGPEHPDVANNYDNLGVDYLDKGEYDKAIAYSEKALEIRLKMLGADHPKVATSYNNLGLAYYSKGLYDQAIGYYEKSLAISIRSLGAEHPDVANCYNNLGVSYLDKAEYDRAIGYYEKALEIRLKALGEKHPDVAQSYDNLGVAYDSKGEYDRAIGYYEKALAIRLQALGAGHPDVAASYNNLGHAYSSKGDFDRAIGYEEQALAIFIGALGAEHPNVATGYINLGFSYNSKGEYDQAIGYFKKALAIRLKVLGAEHPDVAMSYNNLGSASLHKGDYDLAINYHEKALEIRLKALGAEHPDVALSYNNLGFAYDMKGEYDRAHGYYEKALAIGIKSSDRRISLLAAANLGRLSLEQKQYPEAKRAFLEGIAVIEQARSETGAGKAEFTARNISLYYLSLRASAAMNDMPGVFDAAEAMRARGFLDRLSLSAALSAEGVPTDARTRMLALNDELESLAAQRSAEFQKPESQQDKQRLLSIVNDLQAREKEFSDLDQSLMSNNRYKELRKPTLASLQDAQQMVADNQAILEYVLWDQENEQQAWCLVIRKSGAELVKLDESFDYSKAVTDYRDSILNGTEERAKLGAQLYAKLISPVEAKLFGAKKLIIVPDGALAFLPFDALRRDGGSPYLAERYQVSLAPSVSVLRMVGGRQYGVRAGRWLALGGARYSGEEAQAQRGRRSLSVVKAPGQKTKEYYAARGAGAYYDSLGIQWDDLPGTRQEVLAVQQTVYGTTGTRVVLGEQASEQLVKQLSASGELAQQRVLHFACHGLFDAEYPAYSAVVLSEVSGALKDTSPEDGYLTVEEVALLKLKADLVNLSACETGLGKVVKGDGVVGLTRAFLVAGANKVGATLWVVDDLATKQFMTRVYGLVEKSGMGYAEAMAQVKREFIKSKDYSNPYYWSPFVLYGK